MRNPAPKLYASRSEYIDPLDAGSTIGYTIMSRTRLNSQMDLSDCNRKIQWYFNNDVEGLKKIDKALEVMTAFRADFISARGKWEKSKKRRK